VACRTGLGSGVLCVAVSPDGRCLAAGTEFGDVGIWDDEGGGAWRRLAGHQGEVHGVAFSADGTRLVSRGQDDTTRVWEKDSGACLEVMTGAGEVTAIAAGASRCPWWAFVRQGETAVESAATRTPVAWYPTVVRALATHPGGRLWVGGYTDHLCLLVLEGERR
jgi:WD40 repeat protein